MQSAAPPSTIRFQGEIDLRCIREVAGALSEAVGDTTRDVVVDLRDVTFMDSTALGAFARSAQQMANQGRRLQLHMRPGPVLHLIEFSRLLDVFEIHLDPETPKAPRIAGLS